MVEQIEISGLDLRYKNHRIQCNVIEKKLFVSILEHGIRDPLQGVDTSDGRILLDGFKRYRCAKRLDIGMVPYRCIGSDESVGIINLIRIGNSKNLSILEQAMLIEELRTRHNMCNSEIAELLERSKSWVSMRTGIFGEMSNYILGKILKGQFPFYSYMYTLRQFIRMNNIKKEELDEFVGAVAGKKLSIRDIEILANGYFKGPKEVREQIKSGNISWGLRRLKEAPLSTPDCTECERVMIKDLEVLQKYMQRVICKSKSSRFENNAFFAQSNLLTGGILKQMNLFSKAIEELYDQSGEAKSNLLSS